MFELLDQRSNLQVPGGARTWPPKLEYSELELLRMALNLVNYGMVAVDAANGAIQFANALGRDTLENPADGFGNKRYNTGLSLAHGHVVASRSIQAAQLRNALGRTRSGLRGLLTLDADSQSSAVAVVPLSALPLDVDDKTPISSNDTARRSYALLMFARQQSCDDSTMALFARERGLTSAEGQVLAQVCKGLRPSEIADHHGVQVSTVRAQLRSIRVKTCSETIRALVQKVSLLPPMARHLSGYGAV